MSLLRAIAGRILAWRKRRLERRLRADGHSRTKARALVAERFPGRGR